MRKRTELGLLVAANGLTGGAATPVLRWRRTLAAVRLLAVAGAVAVLAGALLVAVLRWRREQAPTPVPAAHPATNGAAPPSPAGQHRRSP